MLEEPAGLEPPGGARNRKNTQTYFLVEKNEGGTF